MKLNEIFDDKYYDHLQGEMKRNKQDRTEAPDDTETSMGDFIVAKFEGGNITYQQALQEIKKKIPEKEQFFWKHELGVAEELMKL